MIYITLRFDDGTISQFDNGYIYMQKYDMPGTIFVIGNKIIPLVQNSLSLAISTPGYIPIPQLFEMQNAGWEIGYHSLTHDKNWIKNPYKYHNESNASQLNNMGFNVTSFALPYSAYNSDVIDHLTHIYNGIVGIPSKKGNSMHFIPDKKLFKSYTITNKMHFSHIAQRIEEAIALDEYLILLFHRISDNDHDHDNRWAIPFNRFKSIIDLLDQYQKSGLVCIRTLSDVINTMD